MVSENNDLFDGASPNASDDYNYLLGIQVPIEDLDLPMPDFQEGFLPPVSALNSGAMPDIAIGISDTEAHSKDTVGEVLPDFARDDTTIKEEDNEDQFNWSSMPYDIIAISDDDNEDDDHENPDILMWQPDGSSVPIKKEDDEVKFIWEKMGDRVIDLDPDIETSAASKLNPGKSFLKGLDLKGIRPLIDRSAIRRAQEALLRARRRNLGIPEPSTTSGVLNGPGLQWPKRPVLPVDDNESAWTKADFTPDEDTGRNFRALKKSYNAKVKNNSNTFEDDIEFARAEKSENLRRARLKAEYDYARGYSDDDNSGDDLFVSSAPAGTSQSKRGVAPDSEDENSNSRSPKQRKPNSNRERTQQELEQESSINMMAGIEGLIHRLNRKSNADGKKSGKKNKGKPGKKAKAGKKGVPKRTKRKPTEVGYLNNWNSLLTSSVFEDADANLGREALPVSGHTHKQKALAALVASVPLGTTTKKDAQAEKNHISRSTVTLGRGIKGTCKADGGTGWKLTGMKSSLHHHQCQGAAFMKERETGAEEPLGGILVGLFLLIMQRRKTNSENCKADAMGLGKTLMTIALMISNPPPRHEKHRATLIVCSPGLLTQWEQEIETHTEDGYLDKVLKHYSAGGVRGKGAVAVLQEQDVILTTYQEVIKSYPKLHVPEDIHDEEELKAWWQKQWSQERDVLHKVQFYRVVLDESQAIKNHETQTSIACRALMAKHRWTLSGTPISNVSLADYSLK